MFQESVLLAVGFLQWLLMPAIVLVVQHWMKNIFGAWIILDLIVMLGVAAIVLFLPLHIFVGLPLEERISDYKYSLLVGVVLSIPLTRFLRRWHRTAEYLA